MREALYRGRRVDNKQWVYGFYFNVAFVDGSKRHFILPLEADASRNKTLGEVQVEVDGETVGQFAGLKDKNKTMIYEGDKMLITTEDGVFIYQVVFRDGEENEHFMSGFSFQLIEDVREKHINSDENYYEVIGNIHEVK
jgi:uncharacterized phage protein (TIGR01671 family)